jgi:glutaredoxin-like YruB-family protein
MPEEKPKVKVYSTTTCPWCIRVKDYLKEKNIPFEEVNVQEDREAAEEMIKKSGQTGVPVVEIGDKIIIGFDQKAIDEALGTKE